MNLDQSYDIPCTVTVTIRYNQIKASKQKIKIFININHAQFINTSSACIVHCADQFKMVYSKKRKKKGEKENFYIKNNNIHSSIFTFSFIHTLFYFFLFVFFSIHLDQRAHSLCYKH